MRKLTLVFTIAVLMLLGVAASAMAGSQDFTLVNETGVEIHEIYLSPSNSNDWEEDVLGDDVLADGEEIDIEFDGSDEKYWDLMIKDQDGNDITWEKINLKETSVITLHYDGKKAWADLD